MRDVRFRLSTACLLMTLTAMMHGHSAKASPLEKWLIMPGPVAAGHAETEDECGACHEPLSDKPQFQLCVACHTEVGSDLDRNAGFHGRLPGPQARECADCHTDHEGRDADIVGLDESAFDHDSSDFELRGAHTVLACTACHSAGDKHRQAPSECVDCHRSDDPHQGGLGEDCGSCHNAGSWTGATFDHGTTAFPLTGAHIAVDCGGCHRSADFSDVGTTCAACHTDDDVHDGRNGTGCADCHVTGSWTTLTFNHLQMTGFPLNGGHGGLACRDCHQADDFRDRNGAGCVACHRTDDTHGGRNGDDCGSCHDVSDWNAVYFDHAARTGFPLPPAHNGLSCSSCHTGNIDDALPRDCGGCHVDDDVHKAQLGTRCERCHEPTDWTEPLWFEHDITRFPLIGAHAEVSCDKCHADQAFHDAPGECAACHEQDDPHGGGFGNQCDSCHNPADWRAWRFDHDAQTGFPLTGAHKGLACIDCHAPSSSRMAAVSDNCGSCHRRDDLHGGRFGNHCESCHTTSSFADIEGL